MRDLLATNRKRIAMLVMVVGVLVVGGHLWREAPRDVQLRYGLGGRRAGLEQATLDYAPSDRGHAVLGVTFRYAGRVPSVQVHRVQITPGAYRVRVALAYGDRVEHFERRFLADPETDVIDIDLGAGR